MSAPILALLNLAPLRSNRLRRAMTRAPEKLAPLNVGASAREISNPDETTGPRRLAFDRSPLVKFARKIRTVQFRAKEVRPGQVDPFEVGIAQIEVLQRFSRKIGRSIGCRRSQYLADLLGAEIGTQSR